VNTIKASFRKKRRSAGGYLWSILAPVDGRLNEQKERTPIETDIIEKLKIVFE